jgi:N-acetylglutamate synthase-like GNAT family acetyltransferase
MVDMPTMHDGAIKIRRGKRTDLPALLALLKPGTPQGNNKAQLSHWRRLASDPRLDFYVAEQDGALCGALLVCYVRLIREYGWRALLDIASVSPFSCTLEQELLNFAKARARQRGCRQLIAWRGEAAAHGHLNALTEGGFCTIGEMLSYDLE